MEQMTLFPPPFKYLIDTSSIFSQKPNEKLPRQVHRSLWNKIEENVLSKKIATCSEIEEEVKKDNIVGTWLKDTQCYILPIDTEIQRNVRRIVTEHPKMILFSDGKGSRNEHKGSE